MQDQQLTWKGNLPSLSRKSMFWVISTIATVILTRLLDPVITARIDGVMPSTEVSIRLVWAALGIGLAFVAIILGCVALYYLTLASHIAYSSIHSGRGRLATILSIIAVVLLLGGIAFPIMYSYAGAWNYYRSVQAQYSSAVSEFEYASSRELPLDFVDLEPLSGIIVEDREANVTETEYYQGVWLRNPVVCATFYNPLAKNEGYEFTYGFVFWASQAQQQRLVLTSDSMIRSDYYNGEKYSSVAGISHPVPGDTPGPTGKGEPVDMCVLADEHYLNVFIQGILRASFFTGIHDQYVAVGLISNTVRWELADAHTQAFSNFRILPGRESDVRTVEPTPQATPVGKQPGESTLV